jgi:hypothetical protein
MELYQVVFLCIAGSIGILYIVQRVTGTNLLEKIVQWKPVVIALGTVLKAVASALPSKDLKTVITVVDAACDATQTAEDLWLMGS